MTTLSSVCISVDLFFSSNLSLNFCVRSSKMSTEQQVTEQAAEDQQYAAEDEKNAAEEVSTPVKAIPLYDRKILLTPDRKEFIKMQSVPLESDPNVRRSPRVKDENHLFGTLKEGVYTIHDMFMCGYNINHDAQCVGWRPSLTEPYKWVTYGEVYHMACRVGSGLIAKGAKPDPAQFIGIYARNSVPWVAFDRACAAYSMVSVPLYDSLGPEALTHIVKQCELTIILVDSNANAAKLMKDAKDGKTSCLRLLVLVEEANDEVKTLCADTSIETITYEQLQELGDKHLQEFVPPSPEDLYTISYTSGTTGTPKGAMHSHKNGVAVISAYIVNAADYFAELTPADVLFSYLPLAHVFERYFESGVLMHGGKIGFFSGDPKKLLDDAAALRPTIFPMVPRVLNRIYNKIDSAVAAEPWYKRGIFNFCLRRKIASLKSGVVVNDSFWDKIAFRKFQDAVGGRVKFTLCAAAPISPEVLNKVRCVFGIPIVEGYGQTESTSGFTTTIYGDYRGGNVGSILPNMIVKLVDVPEKEYYAKDNKGEVCCKGLSVFQGYYRNEDKTKETIDEEGWLHTGDIGEWLPDGSLKIIDRRKNIFKLSQGEYIAPEKIEQVYQMCGIIAQVYVHGHSLKSSIVGIVIPAEENISAWCREHGINVEGKSFQDICRMDEVSRALLHQMNAEGRLHGLKSFELVRKIYVSSELFTVENDLLTPTLKSRRARIEKHYEDKLEEMYSGLD